MFVSQPSYLCQRIETSVAMAMSIPVPVGGNRGIFGSVMGQINALLNQTVYHSFRLCCVSMVGG